MREPVIFDTSVWIDFFNKKDTRESLLLEQYILADDEVLMVPIILQEILQGIREGKMYNQIKEALSFFRLLELPAYHTAVGAAELYRSLRKQGVTIRKSNDCLIAYYAIWFSAPLVHTDRDFDQISKYSDLNILK
ncbi:PIN domain nuclease [Sphingobacterium phlebotomi]|uniref:PIN domain nuclease n=1 Tax=Sphingobacterium phlebotomi TaxID=2605433 RepID=A0A5D4H7Z2_9SPHI|nr:PIN domain nuclease [Sphingobacterium phlebotomi]TYR35565.1 PIN domain nuclease [Sphingobacterium phlebotomi]